MVNQQHQQSIRAENEKVRQCRQLEVGDSVMSRDYRGDLKWRSGLIVKKTGPLMYEVQVAPGIIWRRHIDQLKPTAVEPDTVEVSQPEMVSLPQRQSNRVHHPMWLVQFQRIPMVSVPSPVATVPPEVTPVSPTVRERRYPQRVRRAPQRLDL